MLVNPVVSGYDILTDLDTGSLYDIKSGAEAGRRGRRARRPGP